MESSITEDYKDFFNFTKVCSFCKKGQKHLKFYYCVTTNLDVVFYQKMKRKIFLLNCKSMNNFLVI